MSEQSTPPQSVPPQNIPQKNVTQQSVPQKNVSPLRIVPQQNMPQQYVAQQTLPPQNAPEQSVPQQNLSQLHAPPGAAETWAPVNSRPTPSQKRRLSYEQKRKVAVITGGTSGIAYAIACQLITTHDLVLNFLKDIGGATRAKAKLEALLKEDYQKCLKEDLPNCGVPLADLSEVPFYDCIKLVQGNIADESTANKIFDAVDEFGKGIDILVHSAGTGVPGLKQKLGDGSLFAKTEVNLPYPADENPTVSNSNASVLQKPYQAVQSNVSHQHGSQPNDTYYSIDCRANDSVSDPLTAAKDMNLLSTAKDTSASELAGGAGGGRESHQCLTPISTTNGKNAIDFSDYDYYQSVYPKAFTALIERAIARQPGGPGADSKSNLSVVAVSSPGCNSTQDVPNVATYDLRGPAKATLEMLVRYYAKRLAHRGIRVNAVIPGTVFTKAWSNVAPPGVDSRQIFDKVTKMIPMKREGEAHEIASAVTFLCSDQARYITGVALPVDGGFHLGGVPPT